MKRILALASLVVLAGCATDGYHVGSPWYGSYDGYAPYAYDHPPYAYDAWRSPSYLYGAPLVGGGVHDFDGDRGRRGWEGRYRDRRHDRANDGYGGPAPAERMDPGNVVRPRSAPPARSYDRYEAPNPTTGMTPEESIAAGGR